MKRMFVSAAAIIFSLAVFTASASQQDQRGNAMGMPMMQDCPMKIQGAELAIADTKDGLALTITTNSGNVTELRRRAEKMAKMHDSSSEAHHDAMISFTAKYEQMPNGARLTLTPKEAEQLEEFRTKVRQHAEQMKAGECSMMQRMMGGMMHGEESQPETMPQVVPQQGGPNHESHHPQEQIR